MNDGLKSVSMSRRILLRRTKSAFGLRGSSGRSGVGVAIVLPIVWMLSG